MKEQKDKNFTTGEINNEFKVKPKRRTEGGLRSYT